MFVKRGNERMQQWHNTKFFFEGMATILKNLFFLDEDVTEQSKCLYLPDYMDGWMDRERTYSQ